MIANPDTAQWHIDFQFAYDGSTAVNARASAPSARPAWGA